MMSNNCEKHERFVLEGGCPAFVCEEAEVTVPFLVRAGAEVRDVDLHCNGNPRITRNSDFTPGVPCAVSRFTVSQRMRVEIPVIFTAETDVGTAHVKFESCDEMQEHCNECPDSKRSQR